MGPVRAGAFSFNNHSNRYSNYTSDKYTVSSVNQSKAVMNATGVTKSFVNYAAGCFFGKSSRNMTKGSTTRPNYCSTTTMAMSNKIKTKNEPTLDINNAIASSTPIHCMTTAKLMFAKNYYGRNFDDSSCVTPTSKDVASWKSLTENAPAKQYTGRTRMDIGTKHDY